MQHVLRFAALLVAILGWPLCAEAADDNTPEYRQADTNFYLKNDVLGADPDAVIVPPDAVTDLGGSFLVTAHRPAPVVYLQQTRDWIEPITPPSMPTSLNIPTDAMQVREPQGDVQVALPSAPADFRSVEKGMTLPNGSVLKTGDNGSVAVLFGGVDSVRLAPDSQAAVQLAVTPGKRDAEVDIRSGIIFSKVGQRFGEKGSYEVHTPFGTASSHGSDFVTAVLPQRVDVWVAGGTVGLASPGGRKTSASVEGNEAFKVLRFPAAPDEATARAESADTLTTILNFIPMANQKLKALSDRTRSGAKLTPNEQAYLGRIRKIPALIKLALVGSPVTPTAPIVPEPAHLPSSQPGAVPLTFISPAPFNSPPPPKVAPKAKSVTLATPAAKPTVKPKIKAVTLEKPAMKAKPVVAKTPKAVKPAQPKPAVVKAAAPKKTNEVKEPVYPRAKPVSAAELAQAEAASAPAPPPKIRVAETSDPNSLGAPLDPYASPIPAAGGTSASALSAKTNSSQVESGSNNTVP
jgi:hypothetical protein